MPYRETENTRRRQDARRVSILQAAIIVFAEQGYHAATVRDIAAAAEISVGTFYVYFPDKETLFVRLFEETARFLLQRLRQAFNSQTGIDKQVEAAIRAYLNIAVYEPAVFHLIVRSGPGSIPALSERREVFRRNLVTLWKSALDKAVLAAELPAQNSRITAEGITGALDNHVSSLMEQPEPEQSASDLLGAILHFCLGAAGYDGAHARRSRS